MGNIDGKLLLILGNGFDMDLGLPTSYKDFVNSQYWPCEHRLYEKAEVEKYNETDCLHDILHEETALRSWYDLEAILGQYATRLCGYHPGDEIGETMKQKAEDDRVCYESLVKSLKGYLLDAQKKELNEKSVAASVLKALAKSAYDLHVFSFNYTDIKSIAAKLGIKQHIEATYMHGNLSDGIILGIESNMDFCPAYRYMCKEYSHHYESRFLSSELSEAKHVVIFGHSLSAIDYHYFKHFFEAQSRENMGIDEKKDITIFTYDEESAWDIRDQLRIMNNKRLDLLYGQNEFRIIRTDNSDKDKVSHFISDISKFNTGFTLPLGYE